MAAVKEQVHESVLFFLCGQDYIYHPTDRKLEGIRRLFIGPGTPFEINGGTQTWNECRKALETPEVKVKTELLQPHVFSSFTRTAGARPGGVANYNLAVNALAECVYAMGPATFLRDMVAGVNRGRAMEVGENNVRTGLGQVGSRTRIVGYMQDMRVAVTPYWGNEVWHLGL